MRCGLSMRRVRYICYMTSIFKSLLVTTQMSFASHISIGIIVVVLVTVCSLVLRLV